MIFLKFKYLLAVLIISTASFYSCDEKDDEIAPNTLTNIINSTSELSLFKAAIVKSGLTTFTDGPGPFTILAPSNAAFNAIGIMTEADINALDMGVLVNLLTYHIISGTRSVIEIPVGPNAPITTQGGGSIFAAKYANGTFINGALITTQDIKAANGFLHIINRVLAPATTTVLALLSANPSYSLFVEAINKGAAAANFTATGPITVFAPNNAAMTAAGFTSTAIAASTAANMLALVRYHIFAGRLFSSEFRAGTLKTVQGTNVAIEITSGNAKIKGTSNTSPFNITGGNIVATNGIIHTIDGVLRP